MTVMGWQRMGILGRGGAGSSKPVFEWISNCFEEEQTKRSSSQHVSAPALGADSQVGGHARWSSLPVREGSILRKAAPHPGNHRPLG